MNSNDPKFKSLNRHKSTLIIQDINHSQNSASYPDLHQVTKRKKKEIIPFFFLSTPVVSCHISPVTTSPTPWLYIFIYFWASIRFQMSLYVSATLTTDGRVVSVFAKVTLLTWERSFKQVDSYMLYWPLLVSYEVEEGAPNADW